MSFLQIITTNQDLQLIQANINNALVPLQNQPTVGGVLLKNISLMATQDNLIQHTLGRTPVIYFIGNLNANSVVWSPVSSSLGNQNWNTININLWCSANCNVALWIN